MKNIVKIFSILLISIVFLGGCASQIYHDWVMNGQVVAVEGKEVVICVTDTDGLTKDSVFNVYRTVYSLGEIEEGESGYSRVFVGKIRLGEKKDVHYAEAIIVSGDLIRHDMVEFKRD